MLQYVALKNKNKKILEIKTKESLKYKQKP